MVPMLRRAAVQRGGHELAQEHDRVQITPPEISARFLSRSYRVNAYRESLRLVESQDSAIWAKHAGKNRQRGVYSAGFRQVGEAQNQLAKTPVQVTEWLMMRTPRQGVR